MLEGEIDNRKLVRLSFKKLLLDHNSCVPKILNYLTGATVRAFCSLNEKGNDEYIIRAVTRYPKSEKAKAIESLVDEVVEADLNDEESIVKAFDGCYGAFIVTNYWETMDVEKEMEQLRNAKEAIKKAGLAHVVISTLEDTREFVNNSDSKDSWTTPHEGMYVPHLDGKGKVTQECLDEGIPATYLYTSFYMENFFTTLKPSRQSDKGPYALTMPMGDSKLAMVAVADIGKMACAILQDPTLIGKKVGVSSESMTVKEIADIFTKVTGKEVVYNKLPWNIFASFGFPGADDLANMFRFFDENVKGFLSSREVSEDMTKKMGGTYNFEEWLTENKAILTF